MERWYVDTMTETKSYETIAANVAAVREHMRQAALAAGRNPEDITLVAATKVQTSDTIRNAIRAGITICGENRVQELTAHLEDNAYEGARVHFIGHLQTNKVKFVVGKVDMIESIDSVRLMDAVEKQAAKVGVTQDILLEVNIGDEASKGGVQRQDLMALAQHAAQCPHLRLRGLMSIPPATATEEENQGFFQETYQLFVDMKEKLRDNNPNIDCLSMGMSGDYPLAIANGSTMVRVGTALFGARPPWHPQGLGCLCRAIFTNYRGLPTIMGFLDELKRLTHPYEDEMEDDYDEDEDVYEDEDEPEERNQTPPPREREEPRRREYQEPPRRNNGGKVVNIHATTQLQVVLVKPDRYENASEIADHLRDKRTVVLNLEKTQKDVSRRLLDFLSGVAYAQEGKIKKVALQTYIVTPYNVDIMGDLIDELENNGLYL